VILAAMDNHYRQRTYTQAPWECKVAPGNHPDCFWDHATKRARQPGFAFVAMFCLISYFLIADCDICGSLVVLTDSNNLARVLGWNRINSWIDVATMWPFSERRRGTGVPWSNRICT